MKLYRVHLSTKWNQTHDLLQRYRLYTNIVGKYFRKNCTSFENRKKGEELCCPVSQREYVYCVYPVMLKAPKQLSNCLKRTEKSVVLIVLIVSYEVRAYTATVVQPLQKVVSLIPFGGKVYSIQLHVCCRCFLSGYSDFLNL
jgi:hypothetical protein